MARLTRSLRWAVLIVRLDPVEGHEQAGTRRGLAVSYEAFHRSGLLTICPITAARDVRSPHAVAIPSGEAGLTERGVILCHQIRTISASRIERPVGVVMNPEIRSGVRSALAAQFGLDRSPYKDGA